MKRAPHYNNVYFLSHLLKITNFNHNFITCKIIKLLKIEKVTLRIGQIETNGQSSLFLRLLLRNVSSQCAPPSFITGAAFTRPTENRHPL